MAYKVGPDNEVAAEVAGFSDRTLQYWKVCLAEIATDPYPRIGYYVERIIPIPPLPMRTFLYWINEETSVSGETLFVFSAEFFPEYALVYAVDEDAGEATIFYLRSNR
jgi:hypothetical protein